MLSAILLVLALGLLWVQWDLEHNGIRVAGTVIQDPDDRDSLVTRYVSRDDRTRTTDSYVGSLGDRVIVVYAADDPSLAFVEGDTTEEIVHWIFAGLGVLILGVAAFNYFNMSLNPEQYGGNGHGP